MTALATLRSLRSPGLRPRRPRPAALLAATLIVVAGSYVAAATLGSLRPHAAPVAQPAAQPAAIADPVAIVPPGGPIGASNGSLGRIDHAIGAWTANLARNAKDFVSATNLATLYEARGRLTGDLADYQRAQDAASKALTALPGHMPDRIIQARLLQTLHDFPGALAAAQAILHDDPTQLQALATEGDAELELGRVDDAAAAFADLRRQAPGAAVTARLSRVAFIRGNTTDAIALALRAYDEASTAGTSGPSLAWYAYLAGTVTLATGAPDVAMTWFDRAVGEWPDSYLVLAGRARAEAALGRLDDAIATYQHAIAIAPQPDALTALGDLYALRGNAKLASEQYATVEAIGHLAALNEHVYNRQLVLFAVNHERDLTTALDGANAELATRKDAYGYDAQAWALLANGRASDADAAMRQALAFGTQDALLDYHAGMIAAAVGDEARARTFLAEAIGLRGALDPLALSRATAALAALP